MNSNKQATKRDSLIFTRKNYTFLLTGILLLIVGYGVMASDKEEFGFGFPGLTLGPVLVLLGLVILFFSIFPLHRTTKAMTIPETDKQLKKVRILQRLTGWIVFGTALLVYTLTAEPTVSLWDCGEFVAAACKLEIPHPPGTPLFLLIGRVFSLFAPDKQWIAFSVNMVSVVASSFTVFVLYQTILIMGKRLIGEFAGPWRNVSLTAAAFCGSMSFAFTDSFWFNATEAEVYALSCLFTALTFWAMLKWTAQTDRRKEDQWLLLIIYLTGLTMGVHLLNLVAIPALAFLVYFKKYTITWKGVLCTLLVSVVLIFFFMEGVIIGLPSIAAWFDRIFVNSLNLSFGSGIIFFTVVLTALLLFGIYHSQKTSSRVLQLMVVGSILVLAGASSNLIIPIRSAYNPPMDENDPEDVMSMVRYLKRDQYGSRPLLIGPHFTAGYPQQILKKAPRYRKDNVSGMYVIADHEYEYVYNPKQVTLFPRLHFTEERHKEAYREWLHLKEGKKPTMKDNLTFLWEYQLGHMFWRYFLWNFAGRESDIQDAGWLKPSHWFSDAVPDVIKNNKARNNYFLIPLLLGLAGACYHFSKRSKDAWVIALLFLFCGVVINVYLNQPPAEPRERDYTYVGAFYAFSCWIGLGVLFITDLLGRRVLPKAAAGIVIVLVAVIAPLLLCLENWNDHDRRNRYFARDLAVNMIRSCAPDSILFTGADNDTFPLWYLQEAEEVRTDVRVCNMSLLNMDWHIRAMKIKCNASAPLPVSLEEKDYVTGKNEYIYKMEDPAYAQGIDLKNYLHLIKTNSKAIRYPAQNGDEVSIIPTGKIVLDVDKRFLKEDPSVYADHMEFMLEKGISKAELIVLDIIATNNWKRPVYFDNNALSEMPYLSRYTVKEGMLYRLLPLQQGRKREQADVRKMYENLMKNYSWSGLNDPEVYTDPGSAPFIAALRSDFFNLAVLLYEEREFKKAEQVLSHAMRTIPDTCVPYDHTSVYYAELLFALKKDTEAIQLCQQLGDRSLQFLVYLSGQGKKKSRYYHYHQVVLSEISSLLERTGNVSLSRKYKGEGS